MMRGVLVACILVLGMGCASKPGVSGDDTLSSQADHSDIGENRDFDYIDGEGNRAIDERLVDSDAEDPEAETLESHGHVTQLGDERVSDPLFNFIGKEGASDSSAGGVRKERIVIVEGQPVLENIYFDFDRWAIPKKMEARLISYGQWMKTHPGSDVLVAGYCDARGSREYNMVLGERRALEVKRFLWKQGVGKERISVISYGKEKPTCIVEAETSKDQTEVCHSRNRRAQFTLQ